eukprot:403331460
MSLIHNNPLSNFFENKPQKEQQNSDSITNSKVSQAQNVNQSFQAQSINQISRQQTSQRQITSSGGQMNQNNDPNNQKIRHIKQVQEVYQQSLVKAKGLQTNAQALQGKVVRRQMNDLSSKLKQAGAASLQREARESSLRNVINSIQETVNFVQNIAQHTPNFANHQNQQIQNSQLKLNNGIGGGFSVNQQLVGKHIVNSNTDSPKHSKQGGVNQQASSQQLTLVSSRNARNENNYTNVVAMVGAQSTTNQQQITLDIREQKLNRNNSRNFVDKKNSISFDQNMNQIQQQPVPQSSGGQSHAARDKDSNSQLRNPYLSSAKDQLKNQKSQVQKLRERSLNVMHGVGNFNSKNGLNMKSKPPIYQELHSNHKSSSSKHSPKSRVNNANESNTIQVRELIKQEYDRIMENKLPNIINLINQEKSSLNQQLNSGKEIMSKHNRSDILECDDTDLFSKMFSKDQLTKHQHGQPNHLHSFLNVNDLHQNQQNDSLKPEKNSPAQMSPQNLQNSDIHIKKRKNSLDYGKNMRKQAVQNIDELSSRKYESNQNISNYATGQNGNQESNKKADRYQSNKHSKNNNDNKHAKSLNSEHSNSLNNNSGKYSLFQHAQNSNQKDAELDRLDKLQLINASASKIKEEFADEESDAYQSELSLSFQDTSERNKLDRIKQLGAPHLIMQDRLNSMNPLTFGDTIRLPSMLNLGEH